MSMKSSISSETSDITKNLLKADEHLVTLKKTKMEDLPSMYLEIFVASWGDTVEDINFGKMFVKGKCKKAESPQKADVVVFVGGADVNPIYYNEERHHSTRYDTQRDEKEVELYEYCVTNGIPMVGVCRGAQFLWVMNGGKLIQDIDGHNTPHSMYDIREKRSIRRVSSVHHQACLHDPELGAVILADSIAGRIRALSPNKYLTGQQMDIEAFFYRDSCCLGFQGHPEYPGFEEYTTWCLNRISEFVCENQDVSVRRQGEEFKGYMRLKPEYIEERNTQWAKDVNTLVPDTESPAEDPSINNNSEETVEAEKDTVH